MGFLIRPFRPTDGAAMVELHRRAILATSAAHYTEAQKLSWAYGLEPELYAVQKGLMEVAVDPGDRAVGYCHSGGDEILGLYIDPDRQRSGVGSALMARGEASIAAGGHAMAKVKATTSAQAFYVRRGYRIVAAMEHKTRGGLMLPCVALEKSIVTSR